jgi:hypothetical protein
MVYLTNAKNMTLHGSRSNRKVIVVETREGIPARSTRVVVPPYSTLLLASFEQ